MSGLSCRFNTYDEYVDLDRWLKSLRDNNRMDDWADAARYLVEEDLFYLAAYIMSDGRTAINVDTGTRLYHCDFYVQWCREIEWQIEDGGGVDCSARGVGKSTLRTKAANIQRILKYPNSTGLLASFTRKAAKKHYRSIKEELELNDLLKLLFPDVLWENPRAEAKGGDALWSNDDGIRVKGNHRKDASLEYVAFIDGTPTGGRFDWISCDDVEDHKIVQSEILLEKLHQTYDSTVLLATPVAVPVPVIMLTNTMYSDTGLVSRMVVRAEAISDDRRKVRKFSAEKLNVPGDGPMGGTPQYPFSKNRLEWYYNQMRDRREYAVQLCCSFLAGEDRTFSRDQIVWYDQQRELMGKGKNIYICVDPSRGIKDPTAVWVWGLGQDRKFYWLDAISKKLDPALPEFGDEILLLATKWGSIGNRIVEIRVEQFGQSTFADILKKHFDDRYLFYDVVPCADNRRTKKFDTGKRDREWERWATPLHQSECLFPKPVVDGGSGILSPDEHGVVRDLVTLFLERELLQFPRCISDDLLDAGSLLWEPVDKVGPLQWPTGKYHREPSEMMSHMMKRWGTRQRTWMSQG